MMKNAILTIFITLAFAIPVNAQTATPQTAYAGDKAIFIYHAFPPASPKYPNNGITGYTLEREDAALPGQWKLINNFHTPQNAGEVMDNYREAARFFPAANEISFSPEASWKKFIKYKSLDSLGYELAFIPTQMAYNILVADTTVQQGKTYHYRLAQIGDSNQAHVHLTNAVAFPAVMKGSTPKLLRRITEDAAIRIEWFAKNDLRSFKMKIYRRSDDEKEFREINPYTFVEVKGDTLKYSIRDEHITATGMYHYFITPVNDFYGGGNIHSDTVHATCLDPRKMLTPQHFSAAGDNKRQAIVVKYRVPNPQSIGSITVMRSTNYDSGYEKIGIASAIDTTYNDYRVNAGQKYYYYLIMADRTGRTSIRSIKTFGLYQASTNDFPARYVTAVKNGKAVTINWQNPGNEPLSGYYVYRSEGVGMLMKRLTVLVPYQQNGGAYTDNYAFKPGLTYGYSVRSENLSNVESKDSNIPYIQPSAADSGLVAPKNLSANQQGKYVRLTWLDMRTLNPDLTGYRISRKAAGENQEVVIKQNYPASFSSYLDTTTVTGKSYVYSLEGLASDMISVKVSSNYVSLMQNKYLAPGSLAAFKTAQGIQLTWGKVADDRIKQLLVYRYTRGSQPTVIATLPASRLTYSDIQAIKGKTNYFYIRAAGPDKTATSVKSNEVYADYE